MARDDRISHTAIEAAIFFRTIENAGERSLETIEQDIAEQRSMTARSSAEEAPLPIQLVEPVVRAEIEQQRYKIKPSMAPCGSGAPNSTALRENEFLRSGFQVFALPRLQLRWRRIAAPRER